MEGWPLPDMRAQWPAMVSSLGRKRGGGKRGKGEHWLDVERWKGLGTALGSCTRRGELSPAPPCFYAVSGQSWERKKDRGKRKKKSEGKQKKEEKM
jgi:hypothetical protein